MAMALVRAPRFTPVMCFVRTRFKTYRNGLAPAPVASPADRAGACGSAGDPKTLARVSAKNHTFPQPPLFTTCTRARTGVWPAREFAEKGVEDLDLRCVRHCEAWAHAVAPSGRSSVEREQGQDDGARNAARPY